MKWIGQHIYDLISRFRSDVYLEDVSTGTIASGGNLGLDSNNKIVKATEATGDIEGVTAGTNLSGGGTSGTVTLNLANASTSVRGAASFASADFDVSSGIVSLKDESVIFDYLERGLIQLSSESFVDNDTSIMTSAAIQDKIYGTTTVGTIETGAWEGTVVASAYLDTDTAHLTTNQTLSGVKTFSEVLILDGDRNYGGEAALLHLDGSTITDANTAASGTVAKFKTVGIEQMIVAATNSSVTTTDAASLYISGSPSAGTNMTITNPWSIWVDNGDVRFDGGVKIGSGATVTSVLDEDAMGSDSATALATQQSIKAYVDGKYTYTYTSFIGISDVATNWAIPHLNGWNAYANQWSTDTSVSATSIDTTISVSKLRATTGFTIPFDGILVGFYATVRNNDNNNQPAVGLFHQSGSAIWGLNASTNFALKAYAVASYVDGAGSTYKGACKAIDLTRSLTVTAGDVIIPAILEASTDKVYGNITMVIKTLIP